MADLLLKKGLYNEFKTKVLDSVNAIEGALYFTEDEGGLYLGRSDKTVVRIQGTVHQYETLTDFTTNNRPPFSTDIVYFIADRDALIRWNGQAWVQLNTPAAASAQMSSDIAQNKEDIRNLISNLSTLSTTVADNKTAIEGTVSGIDTRLKTAEGEIDILQEQIATKVEQSVFNTLSGTVKELGDAVTDIENNYVENNTFNTTIESINANIEEINDALGLGNGTVDNTIASRVAALESDNSTNKTNISNNQQQIQELSENLGTTNTNITDLDERLTTAEGNITGLDERLTTAEGNITGLDGRLTTAEGQISTLLGDLSEAEEAINELSDKVGTLETNSATKGELEQLNTDLTEEINDLKTKTDITDNNLNDLTERVNTAEGKIAEQGEQIKEINDTLSTTLPTLATKVEVSALSDELKAEIDADILAANAMTYKGGVASKEALPSAPAIGDTYVVTNEDGFTLADNTFVYAGDLLIAQSRNGTEVNGVIPANQLQWDHVFTGYSSIHNPKLTTEDIDGTSVITLTDFAENPIGQVYLESASENIVISIDSEKTNTVKFELQWGSF